MSCQFCNGRHNNNYAGLGQDAQGLGNMAASNQLAQVYANNQQFAQVPVAKRLVWTRERPNADGWYWHREPMRDGQWWDAVVVRIEGGRLQREEHSSDISRSEYDGDEWAGPIPGPEEP